MGNHLIPIKVEGNEAVYGFAVYNKESNLTQIFLMNKSNVEAKIRFVPKGKTFGITTVERLESPGKITTENFVDKPLSITLSPMSFTRIAGSN